MDTASCLKTEFLDNFDISSSIRFSSNSCVSVCVSIKTYVSIFTSIQSVDLETSSTNRQTNFCLFVVGWIKILSPNTTSICFCFKYLRVKAKRSSTTLLSVNSLIVYSHTRFSSYWSNCWSLSAKMVNFSVLKEDNKFQHRIFLCWKKTTPCLKAQTQVSSRLYRQLSTQPFYLQTSNNPKEYIFSANNIYQNTYFHIFKLFIF